MALRDSWHRTLVYFGLAEERSGYTEEYEAVPEREEREVRTRDAGPIRRSRNSRKDPFDDIFAEDDDGYGSAKTAVVRASNGRSSRDDDRSDVRVHLVIPKSFNDAQQVADKFKESIPVILNLQNSEQDLSKRLIDFASGLTYALDGGMQRIADKVFLLTPSNVDVSAEERARLIETGFFNQS